MKSVCKTFSLVFLVLFAAACGNGGSDSCGFTSFDPATFDLNGTWQVTETSSSSDPDCDGDVRTYQLEITVSGNDITAFSPDLNATFNGEISGNEIRWSGSFPDGNGTSTISCAQLTATSATVVTGTSSFDFEEPDFSCSGTVSISATKI